MFEFVLVEVSLLLPRVTLVFEFTLSVVRDEFVLSLTSPEFLFCLVVFHSWLLRVVPLVDVPVVSPRFTLPLDVALFPRFTVPLSLFLDVEALPEFVPFTLADVLPLSVFSIKSRVLLALVFAFLLEKDLSGFFLS